MGGGWHEDWKQERIVASTGSRSGPYMVTLGSGWLFVCNNVKYECATTELECATAQSLNAQISKYYINSRCNHI